MISPTETPRAANRVVDACQWSGPVRGWRRDLLEGERRWMAEWERYMATRREPAPRRVPVRR